MSASTGGQSLDPVQGVLEILDRAAMTGTNKLGLLLTLLDLLPALEEERTISRRQLAERYFEIHWEHGRPFGDVALKQSSVHKLRKDGTAATDTTVMQEVHKLREMLKAESSGLHDKPLVVVKSRVGDGTPLGRAWKRKLRQSIKETEKALWKNPVQLLQKLPGDPDCFLYEYDADELKLLPGVAEALVRYAGILRPLIEFRFVQTVMRINRGVLDFDTEDVYSHLFGKARFMPPEAMRRELVNIQGGCCILTGERLQSSGSSLDHVIPWSRARLSQIENFLVTTKSVNSKKSDTLLSPEMVDKWLDFVDLNASEIRQCAEEFGWPTDFDRVRAVAMQTYSALNPAAGVWNGSSGIQPLGNRGRAAVLDSLSQQ
ncbi:MAG: hypothetical protein OXF75_07855 [Acidimicrobiaceae bacterium]|nr:hypothetical protein [Acidimicrobiaceae bacterium]